MIWQNPFYLLALLLLPLFYLWKEKNSNKPHLHFPKSPALKKIKKNRSLFEKTRKLNPYFLIFFILLALARPQKLLINNEQINQGITIMLALDVSGSMAAEDLAPNRLNAAKNTIKTFISLRKHDQIGLVVFGSDAYSQCPLTLDYQLLSQLTSQVEIGAAGNETAIGTAIATSLNRLKNSQSKSKIIILLTDGENNKGQISPENAASLAQSLGIKIYTIGVGQEGGAPIPYYDENFGKQYYRDNFGRVLLTKLDEVTLKKIASTTNGMYFRAENLDELTQIYQQINNLETSQIKSNRYEEKKDYFPLLLWIILGLSFIELIYQLKDKKTLP